MIEKLQELRVSNEAMNDPLELRRRIADEGYLFFKHLQSPDKLLALRREMLTVISHGVTGGATCESIAERYDSGGRSAFTADEAYFNLLVGGGLDFEDIENVPVFRALAGIGIGDEADLQADAWLRECPPELEFFGFRAAPSVVDTSSAPMQLLAACHEQLNGSPLTFTADTATTDQRFFLNELGIPATCYGPTGEHIHAADERVFIPSIRQTARVLALFILRWCGVAEGA